MELVAINEHAGMYKLQSREYIAFTNSLFDCLLYIEASNKSSYDKQIVIGLEITLLTYNLSKKNQN
jgi:hypothetical protein